MSGRMDCTYPVPLQITSGGTETPTYGGARTSPGIRSGALNREALALCALVGLGAALRAFQLGTQSLWLDELGSVLVSRRDWPAIIAAAAGDVEPPLYYFILHLFQQFGSDETAVRFESLVFSIAAIPLFYLLARRLFDSRVALCATLILVFSPFHILFAQEARMYAQLAFFVLGALYFFVRATASHKARDWVLFVLATSLALYSHNLGILYLLALDVFVVLRYCEWRARLGALIAAHAAIFALFAPWLVFLPQQMMVVYSGYLGGMPSSLAPVWTAFLFLFSNTVPTPLLAPALFVLLALAVLAAIGVGKMNASGSSVREGLMLALAVLLVPILSLYALSFVRPMYVERTIMPASLGLYLSLAWAIMSVKPRPLILGLGGVMFLIMLSAWYRYSFDPMVQKPPMREVAHILSAEFGDGDVVAHTSDFSAQAFMYYAPNLTSRFISGDPDYVERNSRGRAGEIVGLVPEPIDSIVAGHSRVWLVVALDHNIDYQKSRVQEFESLYQRMDAQDVGRIDLLLYEVRP